MIRKIYHNGKNNESHILAFINLTCSAVMLCCVIWIRYDYSKLFLLKCVKSPLRTRTVRKVQFLVDKAAFLYFLIPNDGFQHWALFLPLSPRDYILSRPPHFFNFHRFFFFFLIFNLLYFRPFLISLNLPSLNSHALTYSSPPNLPWFNVSPLCTSDHTRLLGVARDETGFNHK